MGTRGYYAYRYRGYYFVYYSYSDSYPRRRGRTFVAEIPVDKDEFDRWLEATKARFEGEIARVDAEGYDVDEDRTYVYRPCARVAENDLFIEWVYTIDLDRMAFSVDNGAHFRLDNIPRAAPEAADEDEDEDEDEDDADDTDEEDEDEDDADDSAYENEDTVPRDWVDYLSLDGSGSRCLDPTMPREYAAEWLPPRTAPAAAALAAYSQARPTRTLTTALLAAPRTPPGHVLAGAALKTLLNTSFGSLCAACVHPPADARFRRAAKKLLCTAAPLYGLMKFEADRALWGGAPRARFQRARAAAAEEEEDPLWFRFRNCAIRLATRLDEEQYLRAAVGDAVLHFRECAQAQGTGTGTKTALLWSIRHVVVVHVDGDGTGRVAHSEAIPVLAAYGQDARALEDAISLLSYCLRPAHDAPAALIPIPVPAPTAALTSPSRSPPPPLPLDVIAEIVTHTDAATFHTLRLVARATRALWARQSRIGQYAVVRAARRRGTKGALADIYVWDPYGADDDDDRHAGTGSQTRRFVALYDGRHPGGGVGDGHGDAERVPLIDPSGDYGDGCARADAKRVCLIHPESAVMNVFCIREASPRG